MFRPSKPTEPHAMSAAPEPRRAREPFVAPALAAMAGIAASARAGYYPAPWVLLAVLALLAWVAARRRGILGPALGWLTIFATFGAWHLERTTVLRGRDLADVAPGEPRITRLRGEVLTTPVYTTFPGRFGDTVQERTRFLLGTTAVRFAAGWREYGGIAEVYVGGQTALKVGDKIEVFGWLSRPLAPGSAGEFHYGEYLHGLGARGTLRCQDPGAVTVQPADRAWAPSRWRDQLRDRGREIFARTLSAPSADLASAMVLGYRPALAGEDMERYRRTGTLHLLVVSGMHLVILAGMFRVLAGMTGVSLRLQAVQVIVLVVGYAYLTGGDPPVVRAAVVVSLWLGAALTQRHPRPLNSLALAALVLLIHDPTDLFRIGTQLSFLAVLAIILFFQTFAERGSPWFSQPDVGATVGHPKTTGGRTRLARWAHAGWRYVGSGLAVSAVVGLVLSPLIVYRFHLLTPVGILLSALLVLVVSPGLVGGLLLLIVEPILGSAAAPVAWFTDLCFHVFRVAVTWADSWPGGHFYVISPPGWWVMGFYLVLLLPWCLAGRRWIGGGYALVNLAWIGLGCGILVLGTRPTGLEYHQLAVGHGNCAVLRLPSGHTVLYDCGSLSNPRAADRVIAPWLWAHGIGSLDLVLVSHADVDHFNALPRIARQFPISLVLVTPQVAASTEPDVAELFLSLARLGIPWRLTWAADRIWLGDMSMSLLRPGADDRPSSDNAASLVAKVEARGHELLLTGDISEAALDQLTRDPIPPVDILIAPHHGSALVDHAKVATWCRPRIVVSTQGRRRERTDPLEPYREVGAVVFRTDREGTISIRWRPEALECDAFRSGRRIVLPPATQR